MKADIDRGADFRCCGLRLYLAGKPALGTRRPAVASGTSEAFNLDLRALRNRSFEQHRTMVRSNFFQVSNEGVAVGGKHFDQFRAQEQTILSG